MIAALLIVCVLCAILVATILAILTVLGKHIKDLEDRVMALASPVSLVTTRAFQDREPADVSYLGEAEEARLSPPQDLSEV
jgi:hypothetical protein